MNRQIKNVRTFQDKLKVIEEIENNPNEKRIHIAKRLGMSPSTLNSIYAKKTKVREHVAKYGTFSTKRKTGKESKFKNLEMILFSWCQELWADNITVDGIMIRSKAKQIANDIGISDFSASNGWISRFKERHGFANKKPRIKNAATGIEKYCLQGLPTMVRFWNDELSMEKSADAFEASKTVKSENCLNSLTIEKTSDCVEELLNMERFSHWLEKLPALLEGYEPKDIYSAYETGLFYSCLPNSVLILKDETCHDGKRSKERLSVLLCVNRDGSDKRQPVVIGKALKPRCFKNIKELPVEYHSNAKAWITIDIFSTFLKNLDAEMVTENRKILLFLDDTMLHQNDLFLKNIKIIFYPPNCAGILQPLCGEITRCFKAYYRKKLVQRVVSMMASDVNMNQNSVKIDILQAMYLVLKAWGEVKPHIIINCFKKCGFNSLDLPVSFENRVSENKMDNFEEWKRIRVPQGVDFETFIDVDQNLFTYGGVQLTENLHKASGTERDIEEDQPEKQFQETIPTFSSACTALEKLKDFLFTHSLSDQDKISIINVEILLNKFKT